MKQLVALAVLLICCLAMANAQTAPDIEKEKAAIKQAALDYAEGYYEGNGERMERAVHALLFKRGLVTAMPQGAPFLVFMNSAMLIEAARSGRGKVDPDKRNISFAVLDLNENTATARIFTVQFNDYLHLVKANGQWRIANVLWCPPVKEPAANAEKERSAVQQALADFVEAANAKDADRFQRIISPEIIRRTYAPGAPGRDMILQDMTGETLMQVVRMGRAATPKDLPAPESVVLDLYENIASVKFSRPNGVDYMHLAKQNGQWRIVNVLGTTLKAPGAAPK